MVEMKINTITPVHIGTGDVYMSSEYFLDTAKIGNKEYPVFRRIDIRKYFTSLDKTTQDRFLKDLLNPKYKLRKVSTEFQRYFAFNMCSSRPNPGNEIHENIKILDKPYIPGSSIKGAIENAILFNALNFADIDKMCNGKKINENIINRFFSPSGNPQESIMRFLQISDTNTTNRPYIYDIQTLKVDKNRPFKNQFKLYYETIVGKNLSCSLTNTYDEEIYKDLHLEDKSYLIDIDFIKESIYEFSKEYIDFEIKFSEQYGIDKSKSFYKSLKKKNTKNTPVLRLGATKGLFATTINLKIRQRDFNYFNKVKNEIKGKKARFDYPITRRVINKTKYPTGWIQFSFE